MLTDSRDVFFPLLLAVLTFLMRLLFRGPVYFADGPGHIASIIQKSYIIQPPGYWLFNRIAGLFPDPVLAIICMNILFSIAGTVVFYFTARFFADASNSFIGAMAYSSIFYIWFSGEIHSTYASQILFPIATFLTLLCYERNRSNWVLCLGAIVFALGAGLRPSDGVFMIPMLLYYSLSRLPYRTAISFLSMAFVLCFGWLIPTMRAFRTAGTWQDVAGNSVGLRDAWKYVEYVVTVKSVLTGVNLFTLANFVRFLLPLVVALWPVLGIATLYALRHRMDWRARALIIWIVPGSLFFVLVLITDPTYLNFMSAPILLLALKAPRRMAVTALWNAILFLAVVPIPSQRFSANVINCYVIQYSRYGLQHQWGCRLSELPGNFQLRETPHGDRLDDPTGNTDSCSHEAGLAFQFRPEPRLQETVPAKHDPPSISAVD